MVVLLDLKVALTFPLTLTMYTAFAETPASKAEIHRRSSRIPRRACYDNGPLSRCLKDTHASSNKCHATRNKCIASSNKCLTSNNKATRNNQKGKSHVKHWDLIWVRFTLGTAGVLGPPSSPPMAPCRLSKSRFTPWSFIFPFTYLCFLFRRAMPSVRTSGLR